MKYYDKILKIAEKAGYDKSDFTSNYLEFLSTIYEEIMKEVDKKIDSLRMCIIKDRKPLTGEEFKAKVYEDYLKTFNEETERLNKEAGVEEQIK